VAGKALLLRVLVRFQFLWVTAHSRVPCTQLLGFFFKKTPKFDATFVLNYRSVDGTIAIGEVVGKWWGKLCCGGSWWESVSNRS
jgi:hypothetical protein